jgi:hypothetical protein
VAIYSLALLTGGTGSPNTAIWELRPTDRIAVLEIGLVGTSAATRAFGLGFPTAIGVGPTNVNLLPEDSADPASTTNATITWSGTWPTPPANFVRRGTHATAQNTIIWRFPRGLYVQGGGSLAVFQLLTQIACAIYCVIDE